MDTSPIQIRVTTRALRSLLDQSPEAEIALESMAAEKVAQELARKFITQREDDIMKSVKSQIEEVLLKSKKGYLDRNALSEHVEKLVDQRVDQAVKRLLDDRAQFIEQATIAKLEARLGERLDIAASDFRKEQKVHRDDLNTWWSAQSTAIADQTKALARDEFVSVIEKVSGLLSPAKATLTGA